MSNLSLKIFGAGLCDEGIEAEKLEKEIARLNNLIQSARPICPHCKNELVESHYEGYYDSFYYWECKCDKLPTKPENKGKGLYV